MRKPPNRTHGTFGTYTWGACRCQSCRRASRDYTRRYRADIRALDPDCTLVCPMCGEWFKSDMGLIKHDIAVHGNEDALNDELATTITT